jgi:hypothetical protein
MRLKSIFLVAVLLPASVLVAAVSPTPKTKTPPAPFDGLKFRAIGPALMSGRIADVVIDPEN